MEVEYQPTPLELPLKIKNSIDNNDHANASLHNLALGVELNSFGGSPLTTTFDGQTVVNTDVLVKFTYFGDANLDGVVNGDDYTLIDNGFNTHLTGQFNGDFNLDGVVNSADYILIDNSFNTQGGISLAIATPAAKIAGNTRPTAAPPNGSSTTPFSDIPVSTDESLADQVLSLCQST